MQLSYKNAFEKFKILLNDQIKEAPHIFGFFVAWDFLLFFFFWIL